MSIKIYTAYKIKKDINMWKLINTIKSKAQENVRNVLDKEYTNWMKNKEDTFKFLSSLYPNLTKLRYFERDKFNKSDCNMLMHMLHGNQLSKLDRDTYDITVTLTIRELDGICYIIPNCDMLMHSTLSFLSTLDELEEYGYWNNTDKPDNISKKEWKQREIVWDKLIDNWHNYLTLDICTYDNFYTIFDLEYFVGKGGDLI